MKRIHIIVILLFVVTIGAIVFSLVKNKKTAVPDFCNNSNGTYDASCVSMSEESKWANANDGMPKGWVTWEDTLEGVTVSAMGPIKYGVSKVITTRDLDLVTTLTTKDSSIRCIGDSEIRTCAIGNHPEVVRYWNVINYFY